MPKRVTDPMLEQLALLMETNRKQSEIIESQAKTIEELRATIVELNASLAWLKRKVFGKMSEKCNPINNGDPMLPFDYGDRGGNRSGQKQGGADYHPQTPSRR